MVRTLLGLIKSELRVIATIRLIPGKQAVREGGVAS